MAVGSGMAVGAPGLDVGGTLVATGATVGSGGVAVGSEDLMGTGTGIVVAVGATLSGTTASFDEQAMNDISNNIEPNTTINNLDDNENPIVKNNCHIIRLLSKSQVSVTS